MSSLLDFTPLTFYIISFPSHLLCKHPALQAALVYLEFRQLPKFVFLLAIRLNKTELSAIAENPVRLRTKIGQKHNFWQLPKVHCQSLYCLIHATRIDLLLVHIDQLNVEVFIRMKVHLQNISLRTKKIILFLFELILFSRDHHRTKSDSRERLHVNDERTDASLSETEQQSQSESIFSFILI
jgi:hypothetical protein